MKTALLLAGSLLLAGLQPAAAYTVQLNGIVGLFNPKMAMFVLGRGENYPPTSFMLAEGESQFGIRLLAVDVTGQRVQIECYNKKSYLNLCGTPNVTNAVAAPTGVTQTRQPVPGELSVASYLASEAVQRIKEGNPLWVPAAPAGRQNTGSGTDNAGTGTAVPEDFTKELWYQDSLALERARAETVAEVLSGERSPYPLTPLTPPGTPGQLLNQDVIYSDHISGFRTYGFVDGF